MMLIKNDRDGGGGGIGGARYFIDHTIRAEQQDYEAEGVEWEHVDYFNNKVPPRFLRDSCFFPANCCLLQPCVMSYKRNRRHVPLVRS